MKNKKTLLVITGIALVILLLAIIIFLTLKNDDTEIEENIDVETLEIDFSKMFDNIENEYVTTLYKIEDEKVGKYKINVNIPYINIKSETDNGINQEINTIFVNKLLQVINESQSYTKLNIDYTSSINGNIVSIAIRCVLKEGSNAQRTIIKTYNYDIEKQKNIEIMDIIPKEKTVKIQNQINTEIEKQIKKEEANVNRGYNVYRRDRESEIYKLENAKEFYMKEDILYIIYSYGNNSFTSEIDLIISKI